MSSCLLSKHSYLLSHFPNPANVYSFKKNCFPNAVITKKYFLPCLLFYVYMQLHACACVHTYVPLNVEDKGY